MITTPVDVLSVGNNYLSCRLPDAGRAVSRGDAVEFVRYIAVGNAFDHGKRHISNSSIDLQYDWRKTKPHRHKIRRLVHSHQDMISHLQTRRPGCPRLS